MRESSTVSPRRSEKLFGTGTRRDFLRLAAVGGAAVTIPSLVAGCKLNDISGGNSDAATGAPLPFDFSKGDIAFLQFFYAYKQLHADVYTRTAATISSSGLTAGEQTLFGQIRSHVNVHRDTLKGLLGTSNVVTITPTWPDVDFKSRTDAVNLALQFSDLSVGMFNGAAQSLISSTNVALTLEMSTVDARHSSAIHDLENPKAGDISGFAPGSQDAAYRLSTIGTLIQQFIIERLQFVNAPTEI